MSRPTILVSMGTRPEAVKLAPVVRALRQQPWCRVRVLLTAQHREMLDQILRFFDVAADVDLDLMRPGQTLPELTARMIPALDEALAAEQPAFVLAQGDTTTVFVTALACFYRGIPFGHVEAGLRTHLKRSPFPEEMNRQLVGRLAELHFAPTEQAARNLHAEGIAASDVHVTGNTVIDALLWAAERTDPSPWRPPDGRRLLLVTAHRRENFGAPMAAICGALRDLADRGDVQVLLPVHRNPNVKDTVERLLGDHPAVRLVAPLDYAEFVAAMKAAHVVLTDSGGVQEEAPSLGVPVVVLRRDTERPEGLAAGTAVLAGTDRGAIVSIVTQLLDDAAAHAAMARCANPYGDGRAAERICYVLQRHLAG